MLRGEYSMRGLLFFIFLSCISGIAISQVGGSYTYAFLDMPTTARITAMGGNLISFKGRDPGQAADNPSLLNEEMHQSLTFAYQSYFAGINNGFFSYTHHHKIGTFNAGIKYIDYGTFREADAGNNELGSFSSNEMALIMGYGRAIDSSFSVGANFKFIYSNLFYAYSVGTAIDLSATYEIKKSMFLATMLIKNVGFQLKPYYEGNQEPLPFDIQFGISKRFQNMPFKFSFIIHNLGRGRLTYPAPTSATGTFANNDNENTEGTFQNVIRHVIVGAEFLPDRNFNFRIAYNFQRRREMVYSENPGTVGLSWGFGLKVSKFRFSYARSAYHISGSPNHFTVVTKFADWSKKKS